MICWVIGVWVYYYRVRIQIQAQKSKQLQFILGVHTGQSVKLVIVRCGLAFRATSIRKMYNLFPAENKKIDHSEKWKLF